MRSSRQAAAAMHEAAQDGRLEVLCDRVGLGLVVLFGSAADPASEVEPRDLDIAVLPRDPSTFEGALRGSPVLGADRTGVGDLGWGST